LKCDGFDEKRISPGNCWIADKSKKQQGAENMTAVEKRETQKSKPRRTPMVVFEDELEEENEELKNDNRLLRKLVAELSLQKFKAEHDL
jgi:transposase-like protein